MKSVSKNELVKMLSVCGQVAEHKSEKMQEHGEDETKILAVLSQEEQNQLKLILEKLQTQWRKDHVAHHKRETQA